MALRQHSTVHPFKILLRMAFDKDLIWNIPEGEPPYKTEPGENQELMLYHEMRRMYIFLRGDHPNQRLGDTPEEQKRLRMRRESNFVQMLEGLHADDAKLVLAVKDKRLSRIYENIDAALIMEAFPDVCQGLNPVREDAKPAPVVQPPTKPVRGPGGKFVKKEKVSGQVV